MSNTAPQGWRVNELGDLASKIEGGGTPPRTEPSYWNGDIPWASVKDLRGVSLNTTEERITQIGLKNSASKLIPAHTMIIASRMAVGKAVYFERDVAINQDLKAFFPVHGVDWKFLLHWYLYKSETIEGLATGSTVKGIRLDDLKLLPIDVPPLPEQQKIATILSSVDTVIEKTRVQIDKLKDLKTGMMQELLTKGIGHTEFKDSPVGRIPVGWGICQIQDVATVVRGASPRPQGDPRFYGGDIPRLMVKDVTRDGKHVTPRIDFLTDAGAKLSRPMPAGTLTIVCSGTVGVPSILSVNACIHDGFLALKDIRNSCDVEFLYYQLLPMQKIFDSSATHGGIFTNLTTEILKEFAIVLPPISEQEEIAKKLSSLDEFLKLKTMKLNAHLFTKRALMQDLLTGKVRVNVEEQEKEPAVA